MIWSTRRVVCLLSCLLTILGGFPLATTQGAARAGDASDLFREEMKQAAEKLHWRGEPLSDDCVYALALTGASWEPAWGRTHLFWMGWESRTPRHRPDAHVVADVRARYAAGDYRGVVNLAMSRLALEEIAANPDLKEAVGGSFLELGQPERAYPIFAAPYRAPRGARNPAEFDHRMRSNAFETARRAGLRKEAVAFALSVLLEPLPAQPVSDTWALRFLEAERVDIVRVAVGILEAPPHLRGLPAYSYAAADLLVTRAVPRLLPLLMALAESGDPYLRARALLGLGVTAYQPRRQDPHGSEARVIVEMMPREYGLSEGQRARILSLAEASAHDGRYRLRAAAAAALGMIGADESLPLLRSLARDRAYRMTPEGHGMVRLVFPVRRSAAAALRRYGVVVDAGGGVFAGPALTRVRRGGQDVTHDSGGLHRDMVSTLAVSPLD